MKETIKDLIEKEIQAIRNIPVDGIIEGVIDILHDRIHLKKGKLIVSNECAKALINTNRNSN